MLILFIYELFHDAIHYLHVITPFLLIALTENLFVYPNYQNASKEIHAYVCNN